MRSQPLSCWPAGADDLRDMQASLMTATSAHALFARASQDLVERCEFSRAVIVSIADGRLTAATRLAVAHPLSDELRRRLLAHPVRLTPGCLEQSLLRNVASVRSDPRPSVLEQALGFEKMVMTSVPSRRSTVALIAAESDHGQPGAQVALDVYGHILGLTLEVVISRIHLTALRDEMQRMFVSADAVIQDALASPDVFVAGSIGPLNDAFPPAASTDGRSPLDHLLTEREHDVARLMVAGQSNREIAASLSIAPDTAKGYVARVLRKLGAPNRVSAVRRYLALCDEHAASGVADAGSSTTGHGAA